MHDAALARYYRTITTFVKRLADPASPRAAAIFNRGASAANVTLTRRQMAFGAGCGSVSLRDVDAHKEVAAAVQGEDLVTVHLQPHEARVLRATCR